MELVLSLFSGIDILGRGFESGGFCVVSGGDLILGHDIRTKHYIKGRFDGVIGGPPCQDFSKARRTPPTGYGLEMLNEFVRVVLECDSAWFLLENVATVRTVTVPGYLVQRFDFDSLEVGSSQSRLRHFQFGSKFGEIITVVRDCKCDTSSIVPCVTASEGRRSGKRSVSEIATLQGLPSDFYLNDLTVAGNYKVIGNGVHFEVARRVAIAVTGRRVVSDGCCSCGCGRLLSGRQRTATVSCRKRLSRKK
jgi:DNA (cytosine-5)-methyltransferase 1